jgi:hypothetical protein
LGVEISSILNGVFEKLENFKSDSEGKMMSFEVRVKDVGVSLVNVKEHFLEQKSQEEHFDKEQNAHLEQLTHLLIW